MMQMLLVSYLDLILMIQIRLVSYLHSLQMLLVWYLDLIQMIRLFRV